ncbi:MAG: pyruvate ferredoxin oxidoreductase, partial [Acidimicrobiales bacterium]
LSGATTVIVVEKAFSVGFGGVLSTDVAMATHDQDLTLRTVIAGLGGRAILRSSLERVLEDGARGRLESVTFLDLDHDAVDRERQRMASQRRSGPTAENILGDLGVVASRIG